MDCNKFRFFNGDWYITDIKVFTIKKESLEYYPKLSDS